MTIPYKLYLAIMDNVVSFLYNIKKKRGRRNRVRTKELKDMIYTVQLRDGL